MSKVLPFVSARSRVFFLGGTLWLTAAFGATGVPNAQFHDQSGASTNSTVAAPQNPSPQELLKQGEMALRSGDLNSAESTFLHAVSVDPNSAVAYANLGMIAIRRQQWPLAIDRLQKAQQLTPGAPEIRLNLSLAYYRVGDAGSGIPLLEALLRERPDSREAQYLLGLCYFSVGRYPDAIRVLEGLWPRESKDPDYFLILGFSASAIGNSELERHARDRFVEMKHSVAEYYLRKGDIFFSQKQYDSAIVEYRRAAQANPNFPLVHSNLGLAYFQQMNFQKAEEELLKDIAIEPRVALNYDRLGEVYFYLEKNEKAENSFQEALRRDPQLASSYFGLARLYHQQLKYGLALNAINEAEKIDPDNPRFHFLSGQILTHMGDAEAGQSELETATRLLAADRTRRQVGLSGESPRPPLIHTVPKPE